MKLISAFCLIFVVISSISCDGETEDVYETPHYEGILDLNKDTFHGALAENEFLLVKFYATWCKYSRALAPEYIKTAKLFIEQGTEIKFAQIDSSEDDTIAKELDIVGYPTIMLFRQGMIVEYFGNRTFEDLVPWINRKMGPLAKELKTIQEAKEFTEANNLAAIGFFADQTSKEAKVYFTTAVTYDHSVFGIISDSSIFEEYGAKDRSIILFKKFDDEKVFFEGELTEKNIKEFLKAESIPFVIDLNAQTSEKVFDGSFKNHLLLFYSNNNEKSKEIVTASRSIAKRFRQQILFVSIDVDEKPHETILETFGVRKEDVPTMRIIKVNKVMYKFKPENVQDLSVDNIEKFVNDALDDKIQPYMLQQDLPENWNKHSVITLVAGNFDKITLDKTNDVLVLFCAANQKKCDVLNPVFDKVGEHLKKHDNFVVARIDIGANELENVHITRFPSIQLYRKDENEVVEYKGNYDFEGIIKFAESGGMDNDEIVVETEDDHTKHREEL